MRRASHNRIGSSGFTLLEILIVMAIFGLIVGAASRGFRTLSNSDLRSAASKLSGAIRYLFDRASATGRIHRLVIDFEQQKYWAEVSDDRFLMARERETEETRLKEVEDIAREEQEEKRLAEEKEEAQDNRYNLSAYQPEEFKSKRARFSAFKELAIKAVVLKGPKVASIFTPRLAEPQSTGRGYIYFFPLGQTEAALVHVTDKDEKKFYSLVVHPLTGRVQIISEYVEPPVQERFDDEGTRIEP